MGAPNVVRGASASGNLSALDALRAGVLDGLCSDYYPGAILHAAMRLVADGHAALPAAIRLVSLGPAAALGLDDRLGSLEPGKVADVVVIDEHGGVPVVTRTLREGREVFAAGYPARRRSVLTT
jgi:alpha-D-ribose 1-methylphosphonate 5-triphosphate diphosphatase